MIIQCSKCGVQAERVRKSSRMCRSCINAYARTYRHANPERFKAYERKAYAAIRLDPQRLSVERMRCRDWWRELRHEVIMAYGGYVCSCCGETEPKFLSIDHIFNDGAKHRREIAKTSKGNGKGASTRLLKWLKDNGYPAGFQVLCMNCNFGKSKNGGACPHKTARSHLQLAWVG